MGHAITLQFALAGYPVHLVGRGEASLEKAMKAIRSDAEDFAEAGLLKDGDTLDAVLARITGYADYAKMCIRDSRPYAPSTHSHR